MSANMMYTAVSGLNTFNEALSVVSNNIANANTTAYKSQTVDFGNLVSGYMPTVYSNNTAQGVGSAILDTTADQTTGNEIQTGLWSDLMVQGAGYFAVKNSNGAEFYTRDGSFEVDSSGNLTDGDGNIVQSSTGANINLTPPTGTTYTGFSIDQYGNIIGTDTAGNQNTIATIGLTTFSNPNGLISDGNNMFTTSPEDGVVTTTSPGNASSQAGTLISGALEGSNVDLTQQMVNLIDYQADYQANSKSIVTGNTMLQTVVNMIAG